MKAFIVDHYGSKDVVRAGEMPEPELREGDVLVQIHSAGKPSGFQNQRWRVQTHLAGLVL